MSMRAQALALSGRRPGLASPDGMRLPCRMRPSAFAPRSATASRAIDDFALDDIRRLLDINLVAPLALAVDGGYLSHF